MKNTCFRLALVLFLSSFTISNAQNNLFKYWFYKDRLNRKFVHQLNTDFAFENTCDSSKGGYSLVAREIQIKGEPNNLVNVEQINKVVWGDALAYQGYYLGVLATEYELLRRNNLPTGEILKELHLAMRAVERIDYRTEQLAYPKGNTCEINGFIQRDDVTDGFAKRFWTDKFGISSQPKNIYGSSPNYDSDFLKPYFLSKDHYAYLLVGYALVRHFVGATSYFDPVINSTKTYNFSQKAIDMVKLIQYRWDLGCGSYRIPHTPQPISFCRTSNEKLSADDGGAEFFPYEHPFQSAVRNINANGSRSQTDADDLWNSFACCTGARDNQCKDTKGVTCAEGVNAFYLNLAAVSNDWYRYFFLRGWKNNTAQLLAELAQKHELWSPPLINHILWGDQTPIDTEFNDALGDMPCDEYHPYSAAVLGQSSKWVVDNRFEKYWHARHWHDDSETGRNLRNGSAIYNGLQYNALDYLLLHNMYVIKGGGGGEDYINYQNRVIATCSDMKLKICHPDQNSTRINAAVVAMKNIVASVNLKNCSQFEQDPVFLAGNNIKLTNGFHAGGGGSNFNDVRIKVRKITCSDYPSNPCTGQRMAQNVSDASTATASISKDISPPKYEPIFGKKSTLPGAISQVQGIEFRVYPNPATDKLNLEFKGKDTPLIVNYFIIDSQGKVIQTGYLSPVSENLSQSSFSELNISTIANGHYIIKLITPAFNKVLPFVKI